MEKKWRQLLQIFREDNGTTHGDIFTPTQIQIVDLIAKRRFPRTQLILPTQYGKSMSVADGVLLRVFKKREKWAIIAPTEEKARIIMDYIIDCIFDDSIFTSKLEYFGNKEKLKQERSKTRITFRGGGEVRVYTGNAVNSKATKSALMGFGAANIILDESALIADDLYATVKRMVGGHVNSPGGSFLLEIGNPFYRNHFHRTWFGDRYKKIFVDVWSALAEGRYTQDYINEMQDEAFFDVLYECKFPDATEVLSSGYRRIVTDDNVDLAYVDEMPTLDYVLDGNGEVLLNKWNYPIVDDKPLLGVDVSGGGKNETKLIIRFPKHGFAMVAKTLNISDVSDEDLEEVADELENQIKKWNVGDYRVAVDAGGVGHGLPAIMHRRGYLVNAVLFGEKAPQPTFLNMRAWMYWEMRKWLRAGDGKLLRDPGFEELKLVYYKRNSADKTQIEPKDVMIKRKAADGEKVESPDTADGLVLTFVDTTVIVEDEDIVVD